MNPLEVNALLVEAANIDPRLRMGAEDRAHMAVSWARLLDDIPVVAAAWALDEHYKTSPKTVTVADLRALADDYQERPPVPSTGDRLERDVWLREQGFDPVEFDRLLAAGVTPDRIFYDHDKAIEGGGE